MKEEDLLNEIDLEILHQPASVDSLRLAPIISL